MNIATKLKFCDGTMKLWFFVAFYYPEGCSVPYGAAAAARNNNNNTSAIPTVIRGVLIPMGFSVGIYTTPPPCPPSLTKMATTATVMIPTSNDTNDDNGGGSQDATASK